MNNNAPADGLGKRSGLICLKELLGRLKIMTDFESSVTKSMLESYDKNPDEMIMKMAAKLRLAPEQTPLEDLKHLQGPALMRLNDGEFICLINAYQLQTADKIAVFNPAGPDGGKAMLVQKDKLLGFATDNNIFFKGLSEFDAKRHSSVFALVSIANHHRVPLNARRVMHDYAIDTDELTPRQLIKVASDNGMKMSRIGLKWSKFAKLGQAFPMILIKKNGKHVIVCGYRDTEAGGELAVLDPENPPPPGKRLTYWQEEDYHTNSSGTGYLIKKTWRLSDADRPFGLLWFVPEFLKLKGVFTQIAFAVLMITLVGLVMPLFFQIVVDKVLTNQAYNTLNVLVIAIFAILVFNAFMEFLRGYLLLFGTNKIDIATATKIFDKLMHLPIDFFDRVPSGVLLKHLQQTEKIRGFLSGSLFFTILEMFSLVIFIPFLLVYSVPLTMVVLGFAFLMALVIALLIKPFQRRLHELYEAEGKRQSMLVESIHGMRTVKSLSLEPVQKQVWNDSTAYAVNAYFRVGKISVTAKTLSQFLEMAMNVTVIYLGTTSVFDGSLSVGGLIAFQMISGRVSGPLVKMVALIHEYQQIAISVQMLSVVMNTPSEPAGGGVRNSFKGKVSFEHVTFQYTPDGPQVVRDMTFEINPGQIIGIVGRSGSGKSTLTKLLQGLYPVRQGLVKVDGIDIREIDKVHLRNSIGVVLQENYFFSGTVRENLSLTKRHATLDEVINVARLAGADEFIQTLPKGYDTVLEENAANLSGGQKQRLAIARALLTDPTILIFDEATSALDPESENVIQENLAAIAKNRTVLIISHRLSIVSGAHKILVIDKGELTDFASHHELLAKPGIYKEFWRQQMERNINR